MGERETLWLIFLPCFKAVWYFFPQEIEEDHLEITGSLNGSISIWMLTKTWDSCHPKIMMCFWQPGKPKLKHFHLPCMHAGRGFPASQVCLNEIPQDSTQTIRKILPKSSISPKNSPKFPQRISNSINPSSCDPKKQLEVPVPWSGSVEITRHSVPSVVRQSMEGGRCRDTQ